MTPRTFAVAACTMLAVAAVVRIHNALTFLPLRGYDAFGHFTYIWYMAETWQVPRPTSGWSFFHPPLHYALMASLWNGLSGVDPILRLRLGAVLMGILSLTHAVVGYVIVRRYFPGDRLIHLLAPGLMLFIPVHIYSAPFPGNEGLGAVLCSLSMLALLSTLEHPSPTRCIVLGLCLGLAMLTKFTALAVVVGSFGALGLKSIVQGSLRTGARSVALAAVVVLAVCGWYYARNVSRYGTPFKLSRDEFMVRHIENIQTKGDRTLLAYLTFDPLILVHPQFPRGVSLVGSAPTETNRGVVRQSVWTGIYANAWFDGFGGWVLPRIDRSVLARGAGQTLLWLGLLPTLVVLLGIVHAVMTIWRHGWDDTLVALLLIFTAMVAIFIHGTRVVPNYAALKATYFMPVTVAFSFWFALGLRWLADVKPALLWIAVVDSGVLAVASVLVFCRGLLFGEFPRDPIINNILGVVYYAGGDRTTAKELFTSSARIGLHLANENLATIAFEEGQPRQALELLARAARLQKRQSFGTPADAEHFNAITQAEYLNSAAVIHHALGDEKQAFAAATEAVRLDPSVPTAHYNLGALKLLRSMGSGPGGSEAEAKTASIRDAMTYFSRAVELDDGFLPAWGLLGVSRALTGDCREAIPALRLALYPPRGVRPEFPVETGRGIEHAASIGRRKQIADLPEELQPGYQLERCQAERAP